MKKNSLCRLFYFAVIVTVISCSKSKTDVNPKNNNPTPIPPVNTGVAIIPSAESITLHKNDITLLSAKLYGTDGSLATTQPTFTWSADTNNVVSVSDGSITAKKTGTATVTVSDGQHIDGYVYVAVVADTTAIPVEPANITFNTIGIGLNSNSNVNIPSYTITDHKGQPINGTPTFFLDTLSASAITNNSISAGSKAEAINLYAKVDGKYLHGKLSVFVHVNKIDTVTHISISKVPEVFWYYNKTSTPLKVDIRESWSNNGLWYLSWFSAAPDKVGVQYPQVISANSDFSLTSKYPGVTPITLSYKNASCTFISGVDVDFSGSWGGATSNGTRYSFCLGQTRTPSILYGYEYPWDFNNGIPGKSLNNFWVGGGFVGTTITQKADGSNFFGTFGVSASIYNYSAGIGPCTNTGFNYSIFFTLKGVPYNTSPYRLTWTNNINQVDMSVPGGTVTMVNGSGNCTPIITTPRPLTLTQVLTTVNWDYNACLQNATGTIPGPYYFVFNVNGAGELTDAAGDNLGSFTWTIDSSNVITLNFPPVPNSGDPSASITKLTVSSFTSTTISFSQFSTYDANTPGNADTITSIQQGCTIGFIQFQ